MTTLPSLTGGHGDPSERKHLVQQAQAQIDEEILARYLPVCALRTKRNALSPVSRLPDELLANVFILYADQHHISEWAKVKTFSTSPARVPPWLRVSYVCRRWRLVALDCPSLWTYVFFISRTWMTVLLQRSQTAPLRVRIDLTYNSRRSLPMLEMLFEHFPRMEEFHIRGLPADVVARVIAKLQAPAPLLQSLQLTVLTNKRPLASLDALPPILPALFSATTPKLRSLDLSRLNVAWHGLTLAGITSLKLLSMPRAHTMHQLSSILSQMPYLTHLELEDILPWSSSSLQDPLTNRITLACLARFCITATIPDTTHFLSSVHIPVTTEIRLKCVFGGHASLPNLLSYLQKRLSSSEEEREGSTPGKPIRSMSIDGSPPQTFFVICSTSESGHKYHALSLKENYPYMRISPLNYDWDREIPLKMDLSDHFSTALTQPVMVDVFEHLSLTHLQSLAVYFSVNIDLATGFWRDLLNLAPKLRFIKLRHTSLCSFVATLAPDHHGWRGQNQALIAHALEEIELEQVSFATVCAANEGIAIFCNTTFQCLCDALARRKHAGYPLKRITILDSMNVGTDEQVDELRGVVYEVIWDGISNEFPDAESP